MTTESRFETRKSEPIVRRYSSDGATTLVVDIGPENETVHTDVVDDTLIVVDDSHGQVEIPIPQGESTTFIQNGVITIEVEE